MPFKGEQAVEFLIETDYTLTGATVTDLVIEKPVSHSVVVWSASIYNVRTLRYVSVDGDLDEEGVYEGNPFVVLGSKVRKGPMFTFKVGPAKTHPTLE